MKGIRTCEETLRELERLQNRSDRTLARKSGPFRMSRRKSDGGQGSDAMNFVKTVEENENAT